MTLPCGTRLTILNTRTGRRVRVKVIDTGAFHVTFDLTARTAMDLCACRHPYTMNTIKYRRGW